VVDHGIPFDVAYSLEEFELLAYAITFAQLENGNQQWDWDRMTFIEKR
jgi:hypothetical protein